MVAAGDNRNCIVINGVDQTVGIIDTPGPKNRQIFFQCFWFSEAKLFVAGTKFSNLLGDVLHTINSVKVGAQQAIQY